MRKSTQKKLMSVFILLMFGGSSLAYAVISAIPSGTPSDWYAQIVILVNEEQHTVPEGVGDGTAKVYTSSEGVLRKSVSGDVTLKDFFDAWGETFNSTCVLDYCSEGSVTLFVNGKVNTAFENYVIQNKDMIIIDYR